MFTAEFSKIVTGEPIYDWNCVSSEISGRSSIEIKSAQVCPDRCSMKLDCDSCLQAPGAEGGWHECRWSIQLGEVCPRFPIMCILKAVMTDIFTAFFLDIMQIFL
jgi:hypothetical protein